MRLNSIKRPISTIRLFEGTLFIKSKKHDLYKPKFFKLFTDRLNIYNVENSIIFISIAETKKK